jgi:hypothetical protein
MRELSLIDFSHEVVETFALLPWRKAGEHFDDGAAQTSNVNVPVIFFLALKVEYDFGGCKVWRSSI